MANITNEGERYLRVNSMVNAFQEGGPETQ